MNTQLPKPTGTSSIRQESRIYFRALGGRIAEARKAQGMTQAELARVLGVSQQTVFAYELGDRRVSLFMLDRLGRVFGVPLEQLMGIAPRQPVHRAPSRKWIHHAERMRRLPKPAQRFVVKIIDLLEQGSTVDNRTRSTFDAVTGASEGMKT